MTNPHVVLITPDDEVLGTIDKLSAHQYAMLHRAFSVFIYRRRQDRFEILLQQRQQSKYHSGGLWTNTCCSHPTPDESVLAAAERRLHEEMGIKATLHTVGKFHYVAVFNNGLFENELDYVLAGTYESDLIPFNQDEAQAVQWISLTDLKQWVHDEPEQFTPWFQQALRLFIPYLKSRVTNKTVS
ncbi:isopentenyl-diphosphate Delta-isomerase [Legionella sp. MW5194]|uniref:isopentenyl-diphosphate Delta-isomerase n=1 Tax=Legionella sp. MW5194 TaxID=2662448 RepID=UPI00193D6D28|nr:isopentenyl-diphosphate Delta-isomerase [Legionella sp. MW5194]QRN02786.1 isopentenyl-diphosphate Delta-isomerase [Legionella sp. MW5194]